MRRVPLPLLVLLVLGALQAFTWTWLLPAFQGQDERQHFSYTQRIVENRSISWATVEDIPREAPFLSIEVGEADLYSGVGALDLNQAMRPFGARIDDERWKRVERRLDDETRLPLNYSSAMRNPPLYPLYEALFYAPLAEADIFTRLFVMRLASIPFLLIAIAATWLLAGEVFGRRRWLQATAAGAVALHPLLTQLAGVVNPDIALTAVYATAFWLAAVMFRRGVTRGRVAGSVALILAGAFTHQRAVTVAIPLLGVMAVRAWPRLATRLPRPRAVAWALGVSFVALVGLASVWFALRGDITSVRVREFGSYVWQFYLPRPDFLTPVASDYGVREVFIDRLFSGYSPLDVNVAPWILDVAMWFVIAAAVALAAAFVVQRDALRRSLPLAVLFALTVVGLVWSLHVAAWRDIQIGSDPIITGRYLLPLLPLVGLGIATVAVALPRRVGPAAATIVLSLEVLLGLAAFAAALLRFYV